MTQRFRGEGKLEITQNAVGPSTAPSRWGRGSHRVIWLDGDSGFDDAEPVRDESAVGQAGVGSGIRAGAMIVAESSRLVHINAAGKVAGQTHARVRGDFFGSIQYRFIA
jgi:hypothetical protein